MNPRVSVIIPTYNRAGLVVEAIESVLAQTRPADEIIVVDDGSKDNTREVLERFAGKIIYLPQANQGVSAARNNGIDRATGDMIAFLDSDDAWHPRKLEIQLEYLAAHPEIGFVGSRAFDDPDRHWRPFAENERLAVESLPLERVVIGTPFATSTVVVRKTCLDGIEKFKVGLRNAEDRELYIRLASRVPGARLIPMLMWSRKEGDHLSKGSQKSEKATIEMINGAFREVDCLRGRRLLKRTALSQASFEASKMYQGAGDLPRAFSRLIRSLILWPLPIPRLEPFRFMPRMKTLTVVSLRLMGLKRNPEESMPCRSMQ